jgi:hypothetical protein
MKKYEFVDEHPMFNEFNVKILRLRKAMEKMSKSMFRGIDYIEKYVEYELNELSRKYHEE